ncbi:UPF0415 protein C7orf25 homolog [Menidia menidia]
MDADLQQTAPGALEKEALEDVGAPEEKETPEEKEAPEEALPGSALEEAGTPDKAPGVDLSAALEKEVGAPEEEALGAELQQTSLGAEPLGAELAQTSLEAELAQTSLEAELAQTSLGAELAQTSLEAEPQQTSLEAELARRLAAACSLLQRAQALAPGVAGGLKLCGRLRAELRFLRGLGSGGRRPLEAHLRSSNLTHLAAVVQAAGSLPGVVALLQAVPLRDAAGRRLLPVDVVAGGGRTWVKAVGRRAAALHAIWRGRGHHGHRSLVKQAQDLLLASRQQPLHYQPPQVMLAFYGGVSRPMARRLIAMGVGVRGDVVAVEGEEEGERREPGVGGASPPLPPPPTRPLPPPRGAPPLVLARLAFPAAPRAAACGRLNLDVTTLIALASSLCHGGAGLAFREPVLTEQAAAERRAPLLPSLLAFMAGKRLFACRAAARDFQQILDTLGGAGERRRGAALLRSLTLVDDRPSQRTRRLAASAKVTPRSLSIFGTGDSLRAVTMTANGRFVRAAANQGVHYSVFLHQPRALTEAKEWRATPV